MSGFVKLHRTLIGHHAFRNDAEAMAFAWMVLRAAWKPARIRYKGRMIALDRGQLSVSQRDMAAAFDRDKGWVERLWKRLRGEAMIEVTHEAGAAIITICNYNEYQSNSDCGKAASEADARQTQGTEQRKEELKEERKKEGGASASRIANTDYAFSGSVIRLNQTDFDRWRQTYHAIPDIKAELVSLDAWLTGQSETKRKAWFHSVPGSLNRKHQEILKAAEEQEWWSPC